MVIGLLGWASFQIEAVRERWEKTCLEGDLSGRDEIWPKAWAMFEESPLIGWAPVYHYYELGSRLGELSRGTHNLYFWVLIETGLWGALPFFAGLWLCWSAAWRARAGPQGVLPMAMLLFLLLIGMKATLLNLKLLWIVLAYSLASGRVAVSPWGRKAVDSLQYARSRYVWRRMRSKPPKGTGITAPETSSAPPSLSPRS